MAGLALMCLCSQQEKSVLWLAADPLAQALEWTHMEHLSPSRNEEPSPAGLKLEAEPSLNDLPYNSQISGASKVGEQK